MAFLPSSPQVPYMAGKHKIDVDEDVFRALGAEASKRGMSKKALASQLLRGALPKETFDFVGASGLVVAKAKSTKVPLREDEKAQQKIRDLWAEGERTRATIARAIGYPPRTTQKWIKEEIEAGRLKE